VDEINAKMIDRFPGKAMVFYSFDSVDDDERNNYPQDFLNSITPNGLPSHKLRIKINCPLILLRNLDPHSGLCNGTHLVVRAIDKHILDVEIVNGTHAGAESSYLGFCCLRLKTCHFLSSSRGSSFLCV
jgi:ATP-dependent DNA helicase PIF1